MLRIILSLTHTTEYSVQDLNEAHPRQVTGRFVNQGSTERGKMEMKDTEQLHWLTSPAAPSSPVSLGFSPPRRI